MGNFGRSSNCLCFSADNGSHNLDEKQADSIWLHSVYSYIDIAADDSSGSFLDLYGDIWCEVAEGMEQNHKKGNKIYSSFRDYFLSNAFYATSRIRFLAILGGKYFALTRGGTYNLPWPTQIIHERDKSQACVRIILYQTRGACWKTCTASNILQTENWL